MDINDFTASTEAADLPAETLAAWTPTTENVREHWATIGDTTYRNGDLDISERPVNAAGFDEWLRQIKEAAWNEGYRQGRDYRINPYEKKD